MSNITTCLFLLVFSNLFMTYAWYGYLQSMNTKPLLLVILVSWGIAFFEYLLQVPANRIGFRSLELSQLKIIQEVISLSVFVPFSMYVMGQPFRADFIWAGCCMVGAVYFIFRA